MVLKLFVPSLRRYICREKGWVRSFSFHFVFLKLVSAAIFHQIFIFDHMIALQKLWKMLLFHLKSSFHSQDIQFFVFLSFPLFLPVGHCFRGWSKINLKVYDVINCLNKNLITYFVWYLEKEIRCDIETLAIDIKHGTFLWKK